MIIRIQLNYYSLESKRIEQRYFWNIIYKKGVVSICLETTPFFQITWFIE